LDKEVEIEIDEKLNQSVAKSHSDLDLENQMNKEVEEFNTFMKLSKEAEEL